ncbi:hypothetical protein [Caulobacter sp. LARHSG274]
MTSWRDISVPERSTTITGSRGKSLLSLAVSLGFVAIGVFLFRDPRQMTIAWLCTGFFGLGAAMFAWLLVHPHTLVLDERGFTLSGGLVRAPKTTSWRDVEGFFTYRLPRGGKMVGYNFAPGVRKDTVMAKIVRGLAADRVLPKGWPQSPDKMAETLNAYRAQALAARR